MLFCHRGGIYPDKIQHITPDTDKRGQGNEKQGGINRKGRYERRRNERRRREREEEFLHVETGSRALHH